MDYEQTNNMAYNSEIGVNIDIDVLFVFVFWILILVLSFFILRKIIKLWAKNGSFFDNTIFLIRLPKEKNNKNEYEDNAERIHEEIARAETVFSSIGGLRAQKGFRAWLFGRNDHFSFEIVAHEKKIYFYAVAPKGMARYLEQQIHAHYPEAVIEEVKDYNIFNSKGVVIGGITKTRRNNIFPVKTYKHHEIDPMNSLLNVLSKLDSSEGMAIQFTVRSARPSWHGKSSKIARELMNGKSISEALRTGFLSSFFSLMGDIAKSAKPKDHEHENERNNRLSAMEEEMVKGIEEKNSKAGLDVNLRIIVSAKDKGRAKIYMDNMSNALSQYNYYEYGNSFRNNIIIGGINPLFNHFWQNKIINDYIYRRFESKHGFLFNTEELASFYHLPLHSAETPNILWLNAKHAPAPADLPSEGIILGENIYRSESREIKIKRSDRRRHSYIIGKSGVGKSKLIASMAIQDIINGEGVCILDPHGDLVEDIIPRIPPERAEDVILFAPADTERPLGLNLLEYDPAYPEQKTFVINEMIKIFDKLYDLKATGGPVFEQYMRNAMLLIMDDPSSGSTLMEVPRVLADADFRRMKLEKCKDHTVVDFWKKEAEKAGGEAALANVVPYVTSKLTSFISNDTMRPIIGQQKSSFNIRRVMDDKKILLLDLSKGRVGEMNTYLLGMILVSKILMSALSRSGLKEDKRNDFYLYIDEFQNFTTDSVCSILSEARKYNLNLIMAHQYIGQLSQNQNSAIKEAVFGNVGTIISFKIGSEDAEFLEKEFSPVFNQYDLINIEKYTAYIKLLVDNTASRPFSMKTLWPLPGIERETVASKIKTLSRLKYGQDRSIVEADIRERIKTT
jgi:hypothetical protein